MWIAYDPQLDGEELAAMEALAADEEYVLASPRDGLPSPVVASAWSAKAPEPSAPCSGGTSESGL